MSVWAAVARGMSFIFQPSFETHDEEYPAEREARDGDSGIKECHQI
jgi:hypothetical protein